MLKLAKEKYVDINYDGKLGDKARAGARAGVRCLSDTNSSGGEASKRWLHHRHHHLNTEQVRRSNFDEGIFVLFPKNRRL